MTTSHKFQVIVDGEVKTYTRYEDIPEKFDNMVLFQPYIPPGPHTDEQHQEIDSWMERFALLMERETK